MLKSLLFTSLVCLALGGGALSSPYPEDSIDNHEVVSFGDDPKLLPIGSINYLDFTDNSLYYNTTGGIEGNRGIVYFNNDSPIVNNGIVLTSSRDGQNYDPVYIAMYITTIPFYNSVMLEEAEDIEFGNYRSEVLFLHLIFYSTSSLNSTAMISIPLGFRASDLNYSPFKWWENVIYNDGASAFDDNYYQGFFKAKQTNAVSLSFYYNGNPSYQTLSINSKLYYNEGGVTYVHSTVNDIYLGNSNFVKFFGNAGGRVERLSEWNEMLIEKSFYELSYFYLDRVPIFSFGSNNYENAYQEGYDAGLNQNINEGGLFSVFVSMFAGLSSFLAISLFPGVTIGGIALIFLVIPLTYGIIKLMRGGGG